MMLIYSGKHGDSNLIDKFADDLNAVIGEQDDCIFDVYYTD